MLGPEHPDTLTSVNNLAGLLSSKGDYAGAEPLYRRAMDTFDRVLGSEHPHTLGSVSNLAGLLSSKGDYAGAEPLSRRALQGRDRVLGPEHPDTLVSVRTLAALLDNIGDYAGAEPLFRRALQGRDRVLGPEHPDTLGSVNDLAVLLYSKGDDAGAEPLLRRALSANERVRGPEHPSTLSSLNNLAALLHRKEDYAGAEPLLRRALLANERVRGPEHPDTLTSLNNLAALLHRKEDYAGAEPLLQRALSASERVLGPEHPQTLGSVNNLAALLDSKGDYAGAEPLYRRALEGLLQISAEIQRAHPDLQARIGMYAGCLEKLGRRPEEIRGALEAMMRPFGMSFTGGSGRGDAGPSPRLRAVIEQLQRDPSKLEEVARQLKLEDTELFKEFVQWIESDETGSASETEIRHPYLELLLLTRRQHRAIEREDYEAAARVRDQVRSIHDSHDFSGEKEADAVSLLDQLVKIACVSTPVKRLLGEQLVRLANTREDERKERTAEMHRCVQFVNDEFESLDDFSFRELCDSMEDVEQPESLFGKLGIDELARQRGIGMEADMWMTYANALQGDTSRMLYCLANRHVQIFPSTMEAFRIAELLDELGYPFNASQLRDRFSELL